MNLNSILLGSENPDKLVDFYGKIFGKPVWEDSGYTGWQVGSGFLSVGPHDAVKGKSAQPGRVIWNIETPELKVEFDRIKATGAKVVQEPYTPAPDASITIATFSDPDDNYFQLMTPFEP